MSGSGPLPRMRRGRPADGPLLGGPILIKDIIDTKDLPRTGGSVLFDDSAPRGTQFNEMNTGAVSHGCSRLSLEALVAVDQLPLSRPVVVSSCT